MIAGKTIERLCQYRRLLTSGRTNGITHVFSHDIADACSLTAVQVRRDLMSVGVSGHPKRGYNISELVSQLSSMLDTSQGDDVILVGLGDLGRALLRYFNAYHPNQHIVASFDVDDEKTDRVINGCRCHPVKDLEKVAHECNCRVAIITVPAGAAQDITNRLVAMNISGILNFSPTQLKVPDHVFLETIDIATALEKVAFMARSSIANNKENA